jgi:hypothetical protein
LKVLDKWRKNKRGVFYIWVAVALFVGVIILLWFPLSWVVFQVIDVCTGAFAYPAEAQGTISLLKNVTSWFVIIAVGGFIVWAYVASQRRAPYTEAVY